MEKSDNILEIGCAEGPTLQAFTDLGHDCVGVELSEERVARGQEFLSSEIADGKVKLISKDIYDIDIKHDLGSQFELIILKDVIEHIFNQENFFHRLRDFLKPSGCVFFGFPPWQMPFGGHQQVCDSRILSKFPYFHLLPSTLYKKNTS